MDIAKQVLSLTEKYRDWTAENLSRLIQIESFSCREQNVMEELKRQMESAGFDEIFVDPMGNVIGRIGEGKRMLAIDAHLDTREIGVLEKWEMDPFSGLIDDGCVCGRGSVNQKGGAASFVTAGRILKELSFSRDLTVFFTGSVMQEACSGLSWKYIIENNHIKPDVVLLTKPTNLRLNRGQRGQIDMSITFRGGRGAGKNGRDLNAVYLASRASLYIEKLNKRCIVDPFLGNGSASVTEIISLSPSLQSIPNYSKIHVDRRLTWGETRESAVAEIDSMLQGAPAHVEVLKYKEKAYTGLPTLMSQYYPSWKLPANHPAVISGINCYEELFGAVPDIGKWEVSTGGSMINGFYGIPCVGFGPGDENLAYSPHERVPIDHLQRAAAFYALFAFIV
jgi:putative selenium metabolism hydrolase